MDITTISHFHDGIRQPELLFKHIVDIVPAFDTFNTTKYFAECRVQRGDDTCMLYAPITPQSMEMAHSTIVSLAGCNGAISDIAILPEELVGSISYPHDCSLLIESLPEGTPLSEALYTFTDKHLTNGLNRLREQLMELDISINNLTVKNIVVGNDYEWHPIRCYMVTRGYGSNDEMFKKLSEMIKECSLRTNMSAHEMITHNNRLQLYRTIVEDGRTLYPLQDGCRRVVTEHGVGFLNEIGTQIIPTIYKSAEDFKEDRAVVTTFDEHMGVIDRRGREIVPPKYDYVEYSVDSGNIRVRNGEEWAMFDYLGNKIVEWHKPVK